MYVRVYGLTRCFTCIIPSSLKHKNQENYSIVFKPIVQMSMLVISDEKLIGITILGFHTKI